MQKNKSNQQVAPQSIDVTEPPVENHLWMEIAVLTGGVGVIGFSPHLGFFGLIAFLLGFGKLLSQRGLLMTALLAVIAASIGIGSREHFTDPSDDLIRNYGNYELLAKGDLLTVLENEVPSEFLFYVYLWGISLGLPSLTPSGLIVVFCVTIGTVFVASTYKLVKEVDASDRSLFLAILLLFFSFFTGSQLVRQMLSSAILVAALMERRRGKSLFYFALAFFFHNFALLGYVTGKVFIHFKVKYSFAIAGAVSAILYAATYSPAVQNNGVLVLLGVGRLAFWGEKTDMLDAIMAPENLLLGLVTSWALWQAHQGRSSAVQRYLIGSSLLWFLLLPLPYLSLRISIILRTMLLGAYIYRTFDRQKALLYALVYFYFIFRFFKVAFYGRSTVGLDLWSTYGWYSKTFLYYVDHFRMK